MNRLDVFLAPDWVRKLSKVEQPATLFVLLDVQADRDPEFCHWIVGGLKDDGSLDTRQIFSIGVDDIFHPEVVGKMSVSVNLKREHAGLIKAPTEPPSKIRAFFMRLASNRRLLAVSTFYVAAMITFFIASCLISFLTNQVALIGLVSVALSLGAGWRATKHELNRQPDPAQKRLELGLLSTFTSFLGGALMFAGAAGIFGASAGVIVLLLALANGLVVSFFMEIMRSR